MQFTFEAYVDMVENMKKMNWYLYVEKELGSMYKTFEFSHKYTKLASCHFCIAS